MATRKGDEWVDAVNLVDADAAIVTTVDFDHQDWLGDERDGIGREKAGIFRAGRPAIVGELAPPQGLLDEAARIGADVRRLGRDFAIDGVANGWRWRSGDVEPISVWPSCAPSIRRSTAAYFCTRPSPSHASSPVFSSRSD